MTIINFLMLVFTLIGLALIIIGFLGISNISYCPLNSVKQIFTSIISIGAVLFSLAVGFTICKNTCICKESSSMKVYILAVLCIISGGSLIGLSTYYTSFLTKEKENCNFYMSWLSNVLLGIGVFQILSGFICIILKIRNTSKVTPEPVVVKVEPVVETPVKVVDSRLADAIEKEKSILELEKNRKRLSAKKSESDSQLAHIKNEITKNDTDVVLKATKRLLMQDLAGIQNELKETTKQIEQLSKRSSSISSSSVSPISSNSSISSNTNF